MLRLFAVIFLHLAGICLAQNSSLPKDCTTEIRRIDEGYLIYNSTRTARTSFAGQNRPWYITLAVTDRRGPGIVFGGVDTSQELSTFISVHKTLADRKNSDIRVCPSMLEASNRTSENPPDMDASENTSYENHSCKGVVSEKCIGEFENSTHGIPADATKCPSLYSLDLSDECRALLSISQTIPRNFSSARCSLDKMPYLDLPEDYLTFGSGLWTGLIGDEDRKDFDKYDLRVQQTIPLLISAAGTNRLICIAPDKVVPGSRKPQLELEGDDDEPEEDENSASRAGGLGAAILLGVGAMIFSLL
ncbi:uncharacterized protein FTJAE_12598 [Fusarium tjaetaba]|uniref:Uncharacterized protein n=1 Tax=Fusarium tjaetaba TaxID=1567544 RepID=A0A8H5QLT7_9HYPO|nr:uncharacterized protein FTJAE_12598 [Fusarium tjaetaba]KAF5617580.1 hypothetical protein FTJAE_12598 [Fusarium tjaetaba]